jgi:hypothetical protein
VPALPKASNPQKRKADENERKIAGIKAEGRQLEREAKEGLQRVGKDGNAEKKNEVDDRIEGFGDKSMAEDSIVLEPKPANKAKGGDDRYPAGRVENVFDPVGNIQSRGEKGKTETKNQVTKRFEARGESIVRCRRLFFRHRPTLPPNQEMTQAKKVSRPYLQMDKPFLIEP